MTAKRNAHWRAFLSVLMVAAAVSIAAGCRSGHISVDKKNAQQIAAAWPPGLGHPKVGCRGRVCDIWMRESFADASEAWLLTVPVTMYYQGRDTQGVNRITLKITDAQRGKVASFRCRLRKAPPASKNWQRMTNVRDAHKMCKGSVAASDS